MNHKSLGQKIREWRIKKGITQTELAEGLVTPSMISQIESDKANPSFKLLEGISRKLGVPIDEFLMDMQSSLEQDTRQKLAKSLMNAKEFGKAIQVFEGLVAENVPNVDEIQLDLAETYIHAKEFDKATRLLEGMLEKVALDRDRSRAVLLLRWLGRAKLQQHDYVMAKHYLNQALKELVKGEEGISAELKGILYHNYAVALTHIGEVSDALDYYKKAISAYQGTPNLLLVGQAYTGLANTYYRLGDYKEAADTTRIAITMFRSVNNKLGEITAKMNYGIFQYEMDNFEEAIAQFLDCIEEFQKIGETDTLANAYGEMGVVHFRMKHYTETEKWCFRALELLPLEHPERAAVYRTMGLMYKELQNFDRALEYILSSVELFEKFRLLTEASKCYAEIVSIYQSRGELDKASEYMQKMTSAMQEGLRARGQYL
jgi:HTH-type transcriptional regulator, quorum sensing regulator NprR